MQFQFAGRTYDTVEMVAVAPNPAHPTTLYVSRDHTEVFVQTLDRYTGVPMDGAEPSTIRYWAQRC